MHYNGPGKILFTLDDALIGLTWLSQHPDAESIWDAPTYAWMKAHHDTYGSHWQLNATLYNTMQTGPPVGDCRLTPVVAAWQEEFQAAADWFWFSFHGETYLDNNEINTYDKYHAVYDEIVRITGSTVNWRTDLIIQHHLKSDKTAMDALMLEFDFTYCLDWADYMGGYARCHWVYNVTEDKAYDRLRAGTLDEQFYEEPTTGIYFQRLPICPELQPKMTFDDMVMALPERRRKWLIVLSHDNEMFNAVKGPYIKNAFNEGGQWALDNGYTYGVPTAEDLAIGQYTGCKFANSSSDVQMYSAASPTTPITIISA